VCANSAAAALEMVDLGERFAWRYSIHRWRGWMAGPLGRLGRLRPRRACPSR
jgi:hypothetical protein